MSVCRFASRELFLFQYIPFLAVVRHLQSIAFMAALVCIALSVGVQFYRAGCVFIATGGSVVDVYNYLRDTRNEILDRRYLDNLDSVYGTTTKVNSRRTFQQSNKEAMDDDIIDGYDFIETERAVEAYENESRDVSVNIMQLKG